jgi:hypothetical protein
MDRVENREVMYSITTEPARIGAMPNQIHGVLNGRPFYFRARHGEWSLHYTDTETLIENGASVWAGWWEPEEALAFCESLLKKHSHD